MADAINVPRRDIRLRRRIGRAHDKASGWTSLAQKVTLDPCAEEGKGGSQMRGVFQLEGKANRKALSMDIAWDL